MMAPEAWRSSAQLRLEAAHVLLDQEFYGECITRAYYAVFSACKALLASRGLKARTHKGVHNQLYQSYRDQIDIDQIDIAFFTILWQERRAYDYQLRVPGPAHAARRLAEARLFIEAAAALRA